MVVGNSINSGFAITLAGTLTTSGANPLTLTTTGSTNVTLPTSGTLATTAQIPSTPITVANGGTGQTTLTDHGVLVGAGTSAITQLAVGATGTVLGGSTGADPSFTATPSVTSITLSGGTALSVYAEGTWTPGAAFGGGTTGITYSVQSGIYTKIGNMVFVSGVFAFTNKGSSTGTFTLTGLPFTVKNLVSQPPCSIAPTNITPGAGVQLSGGQFLANTTQMVLNSLNLTTGALGNPADTAFANNSNLYIAGCYTV